MSEQNQERIATDPPFMHVISVLVVILALVLLAAIFNNSYERISTLTVNETYLEKCNPWKQATVKDVKNGFLVFCATDLVEKTKTCKSIDSSGFIKNYKKENECQNQ